MFRITLRRRAPPYKGTRNFSLLFITKCHCKRLVIKKKGSESASIWKGNTDLEKSLLIIDIKGAPKKATNVITRERKIKKEE